MKCKFILVLLGLFDIVFSTSRGLGQVSFYQPPTYAGSGSVFVADFNGDGKPDLLTSDGTLNFGNGDGTFRLGRSVSVTSGVPVAVADFNGDGKFDILEDQAASTGALFVLLGNGDGTFQPAIATQVVLPGSGWVGAALDLNGNGKADVVVVSGSSLLVYLGKGDGTFASAMSYSLGPLGPSYYLSMLSVGDFNGDGRIDIVLTVPGSVTVVSPVGQEIVLLGNGDGTFQAAKTSSGLCYPQFVATGDFNGDGRLDLAVVDDCAASGKLISTVYILAGNGDGTFQPPVASFSGTGFLFAGDVNGDGKMDLILEPDSAEAQIYVGNGDGTFTNASSYVLSTGPQGSYSAVADFNTDGNLDIAGGNGVLLGNGNGTFQGIPLAVLTTVFSGIEYTGTPVIGRFNNDDIPEVAVLQSGRVPLVTILTNDGTGLLSLAHTYPLQLPEGMSGWTGVAGDFNGDGNLDLIVPYEGPPDPMHQYWLNWSYETLLGNGDGTFQAPVRYPIEDGWTWGSAIPVAVGDFNRDQKLDLALTNGSGVGPGGQEPYIEVLLGNGDGSFATPTHLVEASFLCAADFNGDGKLDIEFTPLGGGTGIILGNGDGTFQSPVYPTNLSNFSAQATADLNNDGRPDLVSSNQVALGNGGGTFTLLPAFFPTGSAAIGLIADFNGDGELDLFVTLEDSNGNPVQSGIMLGKGDGTFAPMINVPTKGALSPSFSVADMNGDGRPDIVFPTGVGVGVWLNTTPGFALSAGALSPATVTAGDSATSTVTITPLSGFNSTVMLSCAGLLGTASCTFSPPTITNSSGTSTLTITTSAGTAVADYAGRAQGRTASLVNSAPAPLWVQATLDFTMGLASMLIGMVVLAAPRRRKLLGLVLVCVLAGGCLFQIACGGSGNGGRGGDGGNGGTPAGTYTVTITGTAGSVQHTTTLTLTVQ